MPVMQSIWTPCTANQDRAAPRRSSPRNKKEAAREGIRAASWTRTWGAKCALNIDSGGDRLELADSLPKVGDLDPAGRGRQPAVAADLRQLHLFQLEPAAPRLEPGDARSGEAGDDAGAQHSNRNRVHHFSSWRSASISRASSSF